MRRIFISFLLLWGLAAHAQTDAIRQLPLLERGELLIRYFEGWHCSDGYVGWGHKIQPGEHLSYNLTRKEADSLLRADLLKLYRHFKGYGEYAFLLAVLSYNVGIGKVEGGGKRKPSRLITKIRKGGRIEDIREEYLDFCRWKGKVVPSIRKRRWAELEFLYM